MLISLPAAVTATLHLGYPMMKELRVLRNSKIFMNLGLRLTVGVLNVTNAWTNS